MPPTTSTDSLNHVDHESFLLDESGICDETIMIFMYINYTVMCQMLNIFGTVTNIINIICFVKQGFKDSVNVSLLGLSISDLGCLVTLIFENICLTPAVAAADLPFDPIEVSYPVSAMSHVTFSRVSSWITAIVTMERCLCIIAPLKIKRIVTPRRTSIVIVGTFILLLSTSSPVYVVNRLGMKFFPYRNKTIFGLLFTEDRENVEKISFAINFSLAMVAFVIVVICTLILVIKLQSATEWRKKYTSPAQVDNVSNRNQKVAKMVLMISTLFITCFIPLSITMFSVAFNSDLSLGGKKVKIGIIIGGLDFFLSSINSSVNICIYYQMSSKYRKTFLYLFRKDCFKTF